MCLKLNVTGRMKYSAVDSMQFYWNIIRERFLMIPMDDQIATCYGAVCVSVVRCEIRVIAKWSILSKMKFTRNIVKIM